MNRPIKFRVWDKENKVMRQVALIQFNLQNSDYIDCVCVKNSGTLYPGMFHLLQFTGLTDRANKEIFEGDILASSLLSSIVSVVRFVKGNFLGCTAKSLTDGYYLSKSHNDIKVIGNIFENPDLMENKS